MTAKLRNFRAFLESHCDSDDLRDRLKAYDDLDKVMPFLLQAVAATKAGHGDQVLAAFCAEFPAADDAFRSKVKRYLDLFVDVLSS